MHFLHLISQEIKSANGLSVFHQIRRLVFIIWISAKPMFHFSNLDLKISLQLYKESGSDHLSQNRVSLKKYPFSIALWEKYSKRRPALGGQKSGLKSTFIFTVWCWASHLISEYQLLHKENKHKNNSCFTAWFWSINGNAGRKLCKL